MLIILKLKNEINWIYIYQKGNDTKQKLSKKKESE